MKTHLIAAHGAMRHVMDSTEARHQRHLSEYMGKRITSTGIVIGGHYVPPRPQLGSEAERIQSVLLRRVPRQRQPILTRSVVVVVVLAVVSAVVLVS